MPTQVYRCPEHGEFDRFVKLGDDVPSKARCRVPDKSVYGTCFRWSPWVPPKVAVVWKCPK